MTHPVEALAAGLLGRLAARPGNLAFSPYSVAVALAMVQHGAVGETRDELLAVLGASDPAHLDRDLADLARRLREPGDDVVLTAANALFGQEGTSFARPFLDALTHGYGTAVHTLDYAADAGSARRDINAWTSEQTRARITEIVPQGALGSATRLVLVNALYLKAAWERPFERTRTADAAFHLDDGTAVTVPMMRPRLAPTHLGRGDGWLAVPLPYAGGRLVMTVVLPDVGRRAEVEEAVAGGGLPAMLASPEPTEVDLRLPRWTVRSQVPLKEALAGLGLRRVFSGAADLSAMTTDERVAVDEVLHEAFVAVDEDGTEAAAATAVVVRATSLVPSRPRTPVVLDRPFLFVVHDAELRAPLFVGRVSDPTT
ncbi:serpin family protein [Nocardioides lijunqiniae]|uniref:serpin family protein n=1 Tax=Nocardioides lijunqiniae TaxID=2760832 RepID=UPI001878E0B3|nr:serpin family protein [Nocardioides lijunqiniae]